MSRHLEFIQYIIERPIYLLKKDMISSKGGKRGSLLYPTIKEAYISEIDDEKIFLNGNEYKVHRVYVNCDDSNEYSKCGWIASSEVNSCMICSVAFGIMTYAYHCVACGNVVCNNCSPNTAIILELDQLPAQRVCNQCFWGQEIVQASLKTKSPLTTGLDSNKSIVSSSRHKSQTMGSNKSGRTTTFEVPEDPSEEYNQIVRKKHHEEFQQEALRRISAGKFLRKSQLKNEESASSQTGFSSESKVESTFGLTSQSTSNPRSQSNASDSTNLIHGNSSIGDQNHQSRLEKLQSFGPLVLIYPEPGFVMKTKRNDMTKVFINVCSHAQVPYNVDENGEELNEQKQIFMAVGPPVEYQNEKDLSYCIIYDIVVHPNELHVVAIDPTGKARNRICKQVLDLISISHYEHLDPMFKILRISSNYKGKYEKAEDGSIKIGAFAIPNKNAFFALSQLSTNPQDVSSPSSPQDNIVSSEGKCDRSSATHRTSSSSDVRQSQARTKSSIFSLLAEAPRQSYDLSGLEQLSNELEGNLKVILKPKKADSKPEDYKSFGKVLEDLSAFERKYDEVVISPEPGFVIVAQRVNKGNIVYVNVCHHPLIGAFSRDKTLLQPDSNFSDKMKNFSIVVGNADNKLKYKLPDTRMESKEKYSIAIDVVIPSNLLAEVIKDSSGELHDKLSVEILSKLVQLGLDLDSDFDLPLVDGGYIGQNLQDSHSIQPVINLTEVEKNQFDVSFVGKVFKQGHSYKSWKLRFVHLHENKLNYYDMNTSLKGEFVIENAIIVPAEQAECNAPQDSFPFKILNYSAGGEFLYCYVMTQKLRELFQIIFNAKIKQLSIFKSMLNAPDLVTGWLKKQGHRVKNWKERFFVLNDGVLRYYLRDGHKASGVAESPLGTINLDAASIRVMVDESKAIKKDNSVTNMCITDKNGHALIIQTKSLQEKSIWFGAIKKHIDFATRKH